MDVLAVAAQDNACSKDFNGAGVTNSKEDVIDKETEKGTLSAFTAQSSSVEEHEHTELSEPRLSVILRSLRVSCSKL